MVRAGKSTDEICQCKFDVRIQTINLTLIPFLCLLCFFVANFPFCASCDVFAAAHSPHV